MFLMGEKRLMYVPLLLYTDFEINPVINFRSSVPQKCSFLQPQMIRAIFKSSTFGNGRVVIICILKRQTLTHIFHLSNIMRALCEVQNVLLKCISSPNSIVARYFERGSPHVCSLQYLQKRCFKFLSYSKAESQTKLVSGSASITIQAKTVITFACNTLCSFEFIGLYIFDITYLYFMLLLL